VAESTVQLPPNSTGTKLRTISNAAVATGAHQEVVTLANGAGSLVDLAGVANLDITLSALRDALETINAVVSGTVAVSNLPATQAVSGPLTDTQLRATAPAVKDDYQSGEVLADQTGAGAVLTFTFAAPRNLVMVHAVGADQVARADPFGGTPSATQGIRCDDGVPSYLPVIATTVKVFAPAGMVVTVVGFSRA